MLETETYRSDVNYDVATRDFKYYIFDWDDNILHMPTKIHLEERGDDGRWRPVEVSTSVFSIVRTNSRYRLPPGGHAEAFREFSDVVDAESGDVYFIRDTKAALRRIRDGEKPGPRFEQDIAGRAHLRHCDGEGTCAGDLARGREDFHR